MIDILERERRNVNQFKLTASHTITELSKTDWLVDQIKASLKNLSRLLILFEDFRETSPIERRRTKEYAGFVNKIIREFNYLMATNKEMNDNLNELNKTEKLHCKISGELMKLKEEINKAIKKMEEFSELEIYSQEYKNIYS